MLRLKQLSRGARKNIYSVIVERVPIQYAHLVNQSTVPVEQFVVFQSLNKNKAQNYFENNKLHEMCDMKDINIILVQSLLDTEYDGGLRYGTETSKILGKGQM